MDKFMQSLVDAPLANPLKINLPRGTRTAKREAPPAVSPQLRAEARAYKLKQARAKIDALLDYYATTAVPFNRIAEHMNLSVEQVTESMGFCGRVE